MDDKVILQVYFYKTYLYNYNTHRAQRFAATKSTDGFDKNSRDSRYKASYAWFDLYSPDFLDVLRGFKEGARKAGVAKRRSNTKTITSHKVVLMHSVKNSKRFGKRSKVPAIRFSTTRPQQSVVIFNHFFSYFFLHFFKVQAVVLAKSLYKAAAANALFKHEHKSLLYRTRFLK